jgi:NADH pyrophosphatase NudC (nudix superfamily)
MEVKLMDKVIVVGVCIKNDNNEILMVQEAEEKIRGLYNIPAGKLDSNESIFNGAIREVKEETGYDVKLDSILCIQYLENKNILKIIFNASIVSGNVCFDKDEIMDVRWISIDELERMTDKELRSYKSNNSIINEVKNNKNYPLDLIENII